MAAKFKKVDKKSLRNDAHFQFHTEFKDLLGKLPLATEVLQILPLWAKYMELYNIEDEGLKKIRKSALTDKIQEADRARDNAFTGMVEQNKSLLRHFEVAKREAAERLQIVFNTYGNVAIKSLNEETSAIYNLLQDLRSPKYLPDTTAAGLVDWATELETRNTAFDTLIKQRDTETSEKSDVNLKEARANLDSAYDEIADIMEAHILLGTDSKAVLEGVIAAFNPTIERYIKLLNARRSKGGKGGGEDGEPDDGEAV
jgi:hypothetical protein